MGIGFAQGLANGVQLALNGWETVNKAKLMQTQQASADIDLANKQRDTQNASDYRQAGKDAYDQWASGTPQTIGDQVQSYGVGTPAPPPPTDLGPTPPVAGAPVGAPPIGAAPMPVPQPVDPNAAPDAGAGRGSVNPPPAYPPGPAANFNLQGWSPTNARRLIGNSIKDPAERAATLAAFDAKYGTPSSPAPGDAGVVAPPAGMPMPGAAPAPSTPMPTSVMQSPIPSTVQSPPVDPGAPMASQNATSVLPRDPMDGYLHGMQAMQAAAASRGDNVNAAKFWSDSETLRQQLLAKGLQVADSQFVASGGSDYRPYVDLYNRYWKDEKTITALQQQPNGTGIAQIQDRDGTSRTLTFTPDQFTSYLQQLRNPSAALQASIDSQRTMAMERFKTGQQKEIDTNKAVATAQADVQAKGVEVAPNGMRVMPGPDGGLGTGQTLSNPIDRFQMRDIPEGGTGVVLDQRTGAVQPVTPPGGGNGWPQGWTTPKITAGAKAASDFVTHLVMNPITGFDPASQGTDASTAARASEIFIANKGAITAERAGQAAMDEAARTAKLKAAANPTPAAAPAPAPTTLRLTVLPNGQLVPVADTPPQALGSHNIQFAR